MAVLGITDNGKLRRLLDNCPRALALAPGTELQLALTEVWKAEKGGTQFSALCKVLGDWTCAALCTSLRNVVKFRASQHEAALGGGEVVAKEKLP